MARYLFSSTAVSNGGMFVLDTQTRETRCILRGSYRGITRGPDGWFYTVSGCRNQEELDRATIYRLHPATWEAERIIEHPYLGSHDLRWIDGHFYLVASVGNQVVRLDEQCRVIDRVRIVEDDRDVCHANCLTRVNGSLYLSVFTLSPGERKEKRLSGVWHSEGKVLELDYAAGKFEILYEPLGQPHSLVWRDGMLYLVESHLARVTRIDLKHRQAQVMATYAGFVRGLAFGPDEAVIGVCRILKKDRMRAADVPLLSRLQERVSPFSGILVVDPKSWRVRRRIPLPETEVYEIVPLDEA